MRSALGSILSAEGMLCCHDRDRGHLARVAAAPERLVVVSSSQITLGEEPHTAHPAAGDGRLLVRHGDAHGLRHHGCPHGSSGHEVRGRKK